MTGLDNGKANSNSETLIDFMARFANSDQFNKVFQEGMGLVEETANYLDGPGRGDARDLDRHGSIAYATESMRLTTRLMQLASWLLLQRAVSAGELTEADAINEKQRINLDEIGEGGEVAGSEQLPDGLKALIARSLALYQRILRMEEMINNRNDYGDQAMNPVASQVDRLQQVFASGAQGKEASG